VKDSLDHFEVKVMPDTAATKDTVAFTEGAKLVIQAKDKENKNVELDVNSLLKFSLLTNEEYGTFINANSDTLKTTPVLLENVRYGDAKDGKIKFAAVKKNPDSLVTCRIRIELQNDAKKKGDTAIVVLEQTLKIVMERPYEVVPRNLRGLRNPPNPTDENKKRFTVQLTRNRVGVASHPFRLTTDYVDGTGGHDHVAPRRRSDNARQTRVNYGYFFLRRNTTEYNKPYNGQTQADGRETFDYVSSEFGDSMRIIVKSTNSVKQKYFKDSVTIAEKVPDLHVLEDGVNYNLIGGTCSHHGPGGGGVCETPNNNHRAANDAIQTLIQIAEEWYRQFPLELILHVNDMSLPYGGGFDTRANWDEDIVPNGAHQLHRNGRNADLRCDRGHPGIPLLRDANGRLVRDIISGVPIGNPDFNEICEAHHVSHQIDSPNTDNEHYHLGF
jgi:hypothetical protein